MKISIENKESLSWLGTLATSSADIVFFDPPYGINTKSDGMGKLSPWPDLMNQSFWYRELFNQARRILKKDGCLWSFLNWRSFVTYQKASCDLGWPIESVLVWDKCWIGPGGPKGLRPSYELIALWCKPRFSIPDRSQKDIVRFKWSSKKPTGHPAEKPIDLCEHIIKISDKKGGILVDPFAGSGTIGLAARRLGMSYMGCELDSKWSDFASKRIGSGQGLVNKEKQSEMFGA